MIYTYKCLACEMQFDKQQSIKDEPIKECPICSGELVKIVYPSAIHFKGKGWTEKR